MTHKYAINDLYIFQLIGSNWVLVNDETGVAHLEGNDVVSVEDFNEPEFTVFESDFNADNAPAYDVRSFVEESAQEHLND